MDIKKYIYDKKWIILFIIIFIVNFFSRFFYIDAVSLWYDEVFSVFHSQSTIQHIKNTCKWDINPPGYLVVLNYWIKLFGTSEIAVRSLSLFSISLAGSILFLICKTYLNLETAIYSFILLLFSKELFYYSLEARGYGFIFLMVVITIWIVFKTIEKPNYKISIILGLVYGWMIYTHYLLGIIIILQLLLLFIYNPKKIKYLLLTIPGIILVLFHWRKRIIEIFTRKTGEGSHSSWITQPSPNDLKLTLDNLFNNINTFWIISSIILIIISYILIRKIVLSKKQFFYLLLFFIIGFGIILLHYYLSRITPMWVLRYFLYSLIGISLLFAYLLSLSKWNLYLKIAIVVFLISFSYFPTNYKYPPRMNYKDAVGFIKDSLLNSETKILVQTIDVAPLFAYYYDKNWFKDLNTFPKTGQKIGVYTGNKYDNIVDFRFDTLNAIVLTQTFENYADPTKSIEKYLDSIFSQKHEYKQFAWIKIKHYTK